MKKVLATAALAGALTLAGVGSASAVELYPANPAQGGVNTGTTQPGGPVDFTGSNLTPGETVAITMSCTPADGGASTSSSTTVVVGADGTFSYTATPSTPGICTLTAAGAASGAAVTSQVTVANEVTPQSPAASGQVASSGTDLANTGLDSSTARWGAVGVGGVVLGTAAVFVARRRTDSAAS